MHEVRTSFKELPKKPSQHLKRVEVIDKSFALKKKQPTKSLGLYLEGKLSLIRGLTVLVCIKSEQCTDSLAPFLWPLY